MNESSHTVIANDGEGIRGVKQSGFRLVPRLLHQFVGLLWLFIYLQATFVKKRGILAILGAFIWNIIVA